MQTWDPDFIHRFPLLSPLSDIAGGLDGGDWPTLDILQQRLSATELRSGSGRALRLVEGRGDEGYEARIFRSGEVEFREQNWHDFFNVLSWLAYPCAKAALNTRHVKALPADSPQQRGAVRDALTLFDESGVVVLSSSADLLQMIREFRWKALFREQRESVNADLRVLPFGHALCEKALSPYRGMTAHALLFDVTPDSLLSPVRDQLRQADALLSHFLSDPQKLAHTAQLAPLPVLGMPGWCADNAQASYYDDVQQFRPGRMRAAVLEE